MKILWWVTGLGLSVLWWFRLADWISEPGTYRASVVYITCVVLAGLVHARALVRYGVMVRRIRVAEHMGDVEPGSTLYAANQRFRYAARMVETAIVFTIGVVSALAVAHPAVATYRSFVRLVVTYFVGSVVLTGYLTYRDLRVLRIVNARQAILEGRDD